VLALHLVSQPPTAYALIAAIGGSALAQALQPIVMPLRWVSGLVLIALAVRGAAAAIGQYRKRQPVTRADTGAPVSPARAYLGLWGITMLNPNTVIYFVALVLASQTTTAPNHLEQAVFVLAASAASASWQLLLASGGALLGRALTGSRGRLITAIASSAVTTALALRLLISTP
jgi:arginine exporter protein ArgO